MKKKKTPGQSRDERFPRVEDWNRYRRNWDAIFGKKKKGKGGK